MNTLDYTAAKNNLLKECDAALSAVDSKVTDEFIDALNGAGKIFFVGVGRVLLSVEAFAKRLGHLGYDVHIVGEIAEPAIRNGDVLVVASGSGESLFPREIAKKAKALGAAVVMLGSNRQSTIAGLCDLMVRVPTNTKMRLEDEIPSTQIMTSLFEQFLLLYGDIVASLIASRRKLNPEELWEYHANLE